MFSWDFPGDPVVGNLPSSTGDVGLIPPLPRLHPGVIPALSSTHRVQGPHRRPTFQARSGEDFAQSSHEAAHPWALNWFLLHVFIEDTPHAMPKLGFELVAVTVRHLPMDAPSICLVLLRMF